MRGTHFLHSVDSSTKINERFFYQISHSPGKVMRVAEIRQLRIAKDHRRLSRGGMTQALRQSISTGIRRLVPSVTKSNPASLLTRHAILNRLSISWRALSGMAMSPLRMSLAFLHPRFAVRASVDYGRTACGADTQYPPPPHQDSDTREDATSGSRRKWGLPFPSTSRSSCCFPFAFLDWLKSDNAKEPGKGSGDPTHPR